MTPEELENTPEELPVLDVSDLAVWAGSLHEMYTELTAAGFTGGEALRIIVGIATNGGGQSSGG